MTKQYGCFNEVKQDRSLPPGSVVRGARGIIMALVRGEWITVRERDKEFVDLPQSWEVLYVPMTKAFQADTEHHLLSLPTGAIIRDSEGDLWIQSEGMWQLLMTSSAGLYDRERMFAVSDRRVKLPVRILDNGIQEGGKGKQ